MIISVVKHSTDRGGYRMVDSCYRNDMSLTVFREKGYRFYFLSNEEDRIHIHVTCEDGEAKFWLEPVLALAVCYGLNPKS